MAAERVVGTVFGAEFTRRIGTENGTLVDFNQVRVASQKLATVQAGVDWIVLAQEMIGRIRIVKIIFMQC